MAKSQLALVAENYHLLEEDITMKCVNKISLIVLFLVGVIVSANARLVVRDLRCLIDTDLEISNVPVVFCRDKERQHLLMLTKSTPLYSETIDWGGFLSLWKLDAGANVLRQTRLTNEEGDAFSLPIIDGLMTLTQEENLFIVCAPSNIEEFHKAGITLPNLSHAELFPKTPGDPNLLQINVLNETFWLSPLVTKASKLLEANDGSLILFPNIRGDIRNVFLRIDNNGTVLQERILRQQYEVCDFDVLYPADDITVVIGRERLRGGDLLYEYSVKLMNIEDGQIIKNVAFHGSEYDKNAEIQTNAIEVTMFPRIISLQDNTFLCFIYKKLDNETYAAIHARRYTQELELIWEKELYDFDLGINDSFQFYLRSFDVKLIDDSRFLLAINNSGSLRFLTFDIDGNLIAINQSSDKQKMIVLHGIFLLDEKIVAITTEREITTPIEQTSNLLKDTTRFYTVEP
jgi:hypothetical protein